MTDNYDALGLSGNVDLDAVAANVKQLQSQVSKLMAESNSGKLLWGSEVQTDIASQVYTVGPHRMDSDASFPNQFDLWIPDVIKKLIRVQIRVKFRPIRSSVVVSSSATATPSGGGATSGASSTSTTPSGGGSTSGASSTSTTPSGGGATSGSENALDGHHHNVFIYRTGGDPGFASRFYDGYPGDSVPPTSATLGVHLQTESAVDFITGPNVQTATAVHTHTTPNHSHNIDHTHATPAHTHNIDHTHSTPDHTHPSHSHTLTLGIAEGGEPAGVRLWIDGVDRSVALGGPWDDSFGPIDITLYLKDAINRPILGAHPIEITTTQVGATEAMLDFYVVANPVLA